MSQVFKVGLPKTSRILAFCPKPYLADAYAIRLPHGTTRDVNVLACFIFSNQPPWIAQLLSIRDFIVSFFGLKTARHLRSLKDDRISIFKVYERHEDEMVLGEDDYHLDFRASVLVRKAYTGDASVEDVIVLSTVVNCHNLLGKAYITIIRPFHTLVVKSSLRRADRIGWPKAKA